MYRAALKYDSSQCLVWVQVYVSREGLSRQVTTTSASIRLVDGKGRVRVLSGHPLNSALHFLNNAVKASGASVCFDFAVYFQRKSEVGSRCRLDEAIRSLQ